jgi:hypothetical protein
VFQVKKKLKISFFGIKRICRLMWLVVILASDDHLLCIFFNKKKWTDKVLSIPFKEKKKKNRPNPCLPDFFFFYRLSLGI